MMQNKITAAHSKIAAYEKDLKLLEPHLYDNNTKYVTKVGNGFDIHRFDLTKNKKINII